MNKTLTSLLACFALTFQLAAQHDVVIPCKHNDMDLLSPLFHDDPDALLRIQQQEEELEAFTRDFEAQPGQRVAYVIPVVFHIIHNNGTENISNAQIEDAIRVLNEDFQKQNPDWQNVQSAFLDRVADVGIEFRLARKDPQGSCTTGITRTVSTLTNAGDQAMKDLIQWPRNKYLNVWVAASANGAAGYTYRPGSVANYPAGDGIVMLHTYVGSIGTSAPSRSRTLTHEVGHWINLHHTWGSSNTPALATNCDIDDNVSDTPNTRGWQSCSLSGTTCNSLDNVENYMEYSYCSKMFTNGQGTRMIAALNSTVAQRNQLWQNSNLVATGVDGEAQLCAALFSGNTGVVCAGQSVTFTDLSYNSVQSRTWSFPGGTPESSTDETPVVTYAEAGTYPVTLTVSDGNTTLTAVNEQYVTVLPVPGNMPPLMEGFEEITNLNNSDWIVNDPNGGNGFAVTSTAAFSGSRSVRLLNTASNSGQVDELLSTTFDMTDAQDIVLTFRYAFARRTSANDDRLRIFANPNCGPNWSLRRQLRGSTDLPTAPNTNASFVPSGPQEWGYAEITNLNADYHVPNLRFKFTFESNGGNNLYIDDINLNGMPVSVAEFFGEQPLLQVVPNPVGDQAQVVFTLAEAAQSRVVLLDVLGRELAQVHQGMLAAGNHRIALPVAGLTSGLYFVRVTRNGLDEVVRFVVE
jgi:PKD repeat protein